MYRPLDVIFYHLYKFYIPMKNKSIKKTIMKFIYKNDLIVKIDS